TADVMIEDSHGDLDTLSLVEPATIGDPDLAVLGTASVTPRQVHSSIPSMLRIHGSGFLPGSRVTLSNSSSETEASQVIVLAPDEIAATVEVPPSGLPYSLTVAGPDGQTSASGDVIEAITSAQSAQQLPRPTNYASAAYAPRLWADQSASVNLVHWVLPL